MTLVTLQRQAPVAPNSSNCSLCSAAIAGRMQDHLLVGQPGTSQLRAVICERCGQALVRLVELCGHDLSLLIQDGQPAVESLTGLPRVPGRAEPKSTPLEGARRRLEAEADTLGRAERALRAEADTLGRES